MSAHVLSNEEAAALLGIRGSTLKYWRHVGKGPPFVKLGETKQAGVAYIKDDVLAWRETRKFASTSGYSPAALSNAKANISSSAEACA
jgi:predicted DNA-binding transcriptional regulator AlpA